MTHNELLDKIYWHWKNSNDAEFHGLSGYRRALRAVVELHYPVSYIVNGPVQCFNDNHTYPCPTIQAIERELSNG